MSFHSLNSKRRYFEEKLQSQKDWSSKLRIDSWASAHPIEWSWINRNNLHNNFSQSLLMKIKNDGEVTQNQLAKLREIIKRESAK